MAPDRVKGIAEPCIWVVRWWTGRKGWWLDSRQPLDLNGADQCVQRVDCHRQDGFDKDVHLHGDAKARKLSDSLGVVASPSGDDGKKIVLLALGQQKYVLQGSTGVLGSDRRERFTVDGVAK